MARNKGALVLGGSAFRKSGDATDGGGAESYGTNAAALALGEEGYVVLYDSSISSSANGAVSLFAVDKGSFYANGVTALTKGDLSSGIAAAFGGISIGNGLNIETAGKTSPAARIGNGSGMVSLANSTLSTTGTDSPILYSMGVLEADNIVGAAESSQLACIQGFNSIKLYGSRLSSAQTKKSDIDPAANAVLLFRPAESDVDPASAETALFQAVDSSLVSAIQSGSLFYLTNTRAKIVLSDTQLSYDSNKAKLIQVMGNSGWGTAGRNGAIATFTGKHQELEGDIEADALSTLDFFLLENSVWSGTASILAGSSESTASDNISVNIDGTSCWTVTGNSTISNLNLAPGGKLVDIEGDSVKIVDGNGFTLVDGASSVTISVTGSFSTTIETSPANEPDAATADRTDFDGTFDIQTAYGTNGSSALTPDEKKAAAVKETVRAWFDGL